MTVVLRSKVFPLVVILGLLLLVACGGNGLSEGGEAAGELTAGPRSDRGSTSDEERRGGPIDDPPPAGEARLELDGETYTGPLRRCTVDEFAYSFAARTQVDGIEYDMGSDGGGAGDDWAGSAGLTPLANGPAFLSNRGTVTVEGPSVMYVGKFDRHAGGGPTSVGEGRLIATCE